MIFQKKIAKTDFTPGMLPQTRRAIFFDVLKLHWKKLLVLGLVLLLFYIPALLVTAVKDIYISVLYSSLESTDDTYLAAMAQQAIFLDILHGAVNILLLALFSVGLAGVLRVLRQYAWLENVHTPTDLGKGIRENCKLTAITLCLCGLIYTLCLIVYYQASAYPDPVLSFLSLFPIGISLLLILPVAAIMLAMIPIYQNTFAATVKNAFFVYSRSVLKTLGALLCCLIIWVPALIPNFYCHFFGSVAAILLTPFALLAFSLFCYEQFDRHLNPLVSPELIGRGIHRHEQNS